MGDTTTSSSKEDADRLGVAHLGVDRDTLGSMLDLGVGPFAATTGSTSSTTSITTRSTEYLVALSTTTSSSTKDMYTGSRCTGEDCSWSGTYQ